MTQVGQYRGRKGAENGSESVCVWNNMRVRWVALWILACLTMPVVFAAAGERDISLLLTPKLLRRLQRDRTRETVRWRNFEQRVQGVPESPERGFELALYYAVTRDEAKGREAVAWTLQHKTDARQVALVLDWCADLIGPAEMEQLKSVSPAGDTAGALRDRLFLAIAADQFSKAQFDSANRKLLDDLRNPGEPNAGPTLYAAIEYLMAYRAATRTDLRESDAQYFARLPKLFLLRMKPQQVEKPDWMSHAAALALVTLDPNLENSQFLQGWAMEGRQMLRDGPGVAYELVWGDPYLPGVAYQNMDPWIYDPTGLLFARTGWEENACWVAIRSTGMEQQNCEETKFARPGQFGTLTLLRMDHACAEVPEHKNRESVMFWKLKPGAQLTYEYNDEHTEPRADAAGLWLVPNSPSGKVCVTGGEKR